MQDGTFRMSPCQELANALTMLLTLATAIGPAESNWTPETCDPRTHREGESWEQGVPSPGVRAAVRRLPTQQPPAVRSSTVPEVPPTKELLQHSAAQASFCRSGLEFSLRPSDLAPLTVLRLVVTLESCRDGISWKARQCHPAVCLGV
eukprot:CAMPEP_0206046142 /NCGR_PEP_ID=MMETSP1466-20131121/17783_1 /ASSEMBLY_ACC=CAM_ASM_001126 /TAXON_ID=44452 /ORGANISM="Pavlova gyrans, Strain CCMP608" /LENGTH=147 /DNA_ID=CAMNT_0053421111 /DNA_START=460 /DNA_END=900 /DNA_ORIENTATION=+